MNNKVQIVLSLIAAIASIAGIFLYRTAFFHDDISNKYYLISFAILLIASVLVVIASLRYSKAVSILSIVFSALPIVIFIVGFGMGIHFVFVGLVLLVVPNIVVLISALTVKKPTVLEQ